jgi:hypothetical protein
MTTVPPPADNAADRPRSSGPHVTPMFVAALEYAAAERGLPFDPWPLPPPPPRVTPMFVALLELAATFRGLPPEPWPLP